MTDPVCTNEETPKVVNRFVESFYKHLSEFIDDLSGVDENFTDLKNWLETKKEDSEEIVAFVEQISEIQKEICECDLDSLKTKNEKFLLFDDKFDLITVLERESNSRETQKAIWSHIQTLYVCGTFAVSGPGDAIKNFTNTLKQSREQAESNLNSQIKISEEEIDEATKNVKKMLQDMTNAKEDSVLADIVSDIAAEVGLTMKEQSKDGTFDPQVLVQEMLSGKGDLMKRVSGKMQERMKNGNISHDQLQKEAMEMVQNLMKSTDMQGNPMGTMLSQMLGTQGSRGDPFGIGISNSKKKKLQRVARRKRR